MNSIFSVSQLNSYIKNIFDNEELLLNITVCGEISGISVSNGNAYFSLKDNDSLINCVMFSYSGTFKIGDKVLATGSPKYYMKAGKMTFQAYKLSIYGEGELHKRFLLLKQKLETEGLFDIAHKKQMPAVVRSIGVVTSKQGAVIQDIFNVISRRNPYIKILLYPAQVQGIFAEKDIIKGIEYFQDKDIDIIIVARGGGSAEDLSVFNSENIARVVFNSNKFILSAIGHETDYTIIDYVADLRAPTPSVAGELVAKDIMKNFDMCILNFSSIKKIILSKIDNYNDNNVENLHLVKCKLTEKLNTLNYKYINSFDKIKIDYSQKLTKFTQSINTKALLIEKSNPMTKLVQGYTKLKCEGKFIKSVDDIEVGDKIESRLVDGMITSKVISKEKI